MKTRYILIIVILSFLEISLKAQVKNVEKEVENQGTHRINRKIDKGVNKSFDKLEKGIGNYFKKKRNRKKKKEEPKKTNESTVDESNDSNKKKTTAQTNEQPVRENQVVWSKFDFIPGDEVIFEDGPSADEENGEFPGRWDLISGQIEIGNFNGENVLMFLDGGMIIPYLKNSKEDYLPDVFTIEFDFYTPKKGNRVSFYLTDRKNNRENKPQEFEVTPKRVNTPGNGSVEHSQRDYTYCENGCWTHLSLAYTKGKLKVYIDDTRLINIPHYEFNPSGFTLNPYFASAKDDKIFYVKNVRIAQGGVQYYDRAVQDGKIVVNGIRFDVNKTTLRPESMGPINKIFKLMQKKPELKFSVEGHTDSDGDEANNQTLSEGRAKTVMNKLVAMGIESNRLSSKGLGDSKPIASNQTPEGKSNNRRVEFIVIK